MPRYQPPVHPLAPVMLAVLGVAVFGAAHAVFGIGKDAVIFAVSALVVFAMPVVVVFGITGIVLGIRRLMRGWRVTPVEKPEEPRKPSQLS